MPDKLFLLDDGEDGYSISRKPDGTDGSLRSVTHIPKTVEGHWVIFYTQLFSDPEVLGIAHSKRWLGDKTHRCAVDYAKKEAAREGLEFVDKTERGKKSKLE